jgi:Family of unknown function (DUF6125)
MSREDLLRALDMFAKSWLAHDGCWFLAAEERLGIEAAIELDTRSWEQFAATEARRIMSTFHIPQQGGLKALETRWACACTASSTRSGWNGRTKDGCDSSWTSAGFRKPDGARACRISRARLWAPSNSKPSPEPSIRAFARRACIVLRKRRKANTAAGNSAWGSKGASQIGC